ncbi:MAG: alpha-ketoacid dehydrogenase subunit beta [Candidatus Hodarchaeales archaeon]|jgi:pyruvate/2-oxoglutarate/acetoin dehydrogenase E1 component
MREITYAQAINEALKEEMKRDDNVIIMGEDIALYGGIFKVTRGILEDFGPERIRDTPISENGIIGAALGASLLGIRPVVEIMYMDFLNECADQLINHLPKMRFMSGGKLKTPVTIRTQYSLGRNTGAQHSQFFPAFYMNTPGLFISLPSSAYDAKGLLKTAIRGENPTLFIECPLFYREKGQVPNEEYTVPVGTAAIKTEGDDVTILALANMVPRALSAAEKLEKNRVSVRVVDPRTLNPLDEKCIIKSVKKTGRIVIVEPDCKTAGVGAEIAAIIAEKAVDYLDAPIVRVAAPDFPSPFTPTLLDQYVPREIDIIRAVKKIVS